MRLLVLSRTRKCKWSLNEHFACLCVLDKISVQRFNCAVRALRMTLLFMTLFSFRMFISRAVSAVVVLGGQVGKGMDPDKLRQGVSSGNLTSTSSSSSGEPD